VLNILLLKFYLNIVRNSAKMLLKCCWNLSYSSAKGVLGVEGAILSFLYLERVKCIFNTLWRGMCILSVRQYIEVCYDEILFEKCIAWKPIVGMSKIAINSSYHYNRRVCSPTIIFSIFKISTELFQSLLWLAFCQLGAHLITKSSSTSSFTCTIQRMEVAAW
jgi:hypothetical protein